MAYWNLTKHNYDRWRYIGLLLKLVKISKSCSLEPEIGKFQTLGLICERCNFVIGLSKFKCCQNPMV